MKQAIYCLLVPFLLFGLSGCSSGKKDSSGPLTTVFSQTDQTNSTFTFQLYALTSSSQEGVFLGNLVKSGTGLEYPSTLDNYLNSMNSATAQQVLYFVKAYSAASTGTNGDVYYEAPVLNRKTVFNGPTTAMMSLMRSSYANHSVSMMMTPTIWQNLLFLIQSISSLGLQNPGGQIVFAIQTSGAVQVQMNALLATVAAPSIDWAAAATPGLKLAFSNPALTQGGPAQYLNSFSSSQGTAINTEVVFTLKNDFSNRVTPDSWGITIAVAPEANMAGGTNSSKIGYTFDYTNAGVQTIAAHKLIGSTNYAANFTYTISTTLLPPVFNPPSVLNFQSNHEKQFDLKTYATDPRNETLTFTIVSVPSGMTLLNGILTWNPPDISQGQTLTAFAEILVTNQDGNSSDKTIPVSVAYDNHPSFSTSPPNSWALNEGTTGTLAFSVLDSDGDAVEISCLSGCNALLSGFPAAAGWPDLNYLTSTIYSGAPGTENILIPFMPSYLQTIVVPQTDQITLAINYPTSNSKLRQISPAVQVTVNLNITNIADPPVWTTQPQASPAPQPTETSPMTPMTGGVAADPGYNPGSHVLVYSFTALSGTPGSALNCSWLTIDPNTAAISGTPPYSSAGVCSFKVRATDALGLYSDSSTVVNIPVTDVPRGITAAGSIPNQTGTENITYSLVLGSYFNDPDATSGDPRENITYTCLSTCAGLPTTGANAIAFTNGSLVWTPPYGTTPTAGSKTYSNIQIQATNKGGFTATQTFNLTINYATTPMAVSFASNSLAVTSTGTTPNVVYQTGLTAATSGTVTMQVGNIPGDTSSYAYTVSVNCSPNCSATLLATSGSSGAGVASFTYTLAPTTADGYAGSYSNFATKTLTVSVTDNASPAIVATGTLQVKVNTVDRPLSALTMNSDASASAFPLTIDASVYATTTINFATLGPDASNDGFVYSFSGAGVGSIAGASWQFNPAAVGCPDVQGSNVSKSFIIKSTSSHGPTITRTVNLNLTNTAAGMGGGCPY